MTVRWAEDEPPHLSRKRKAEEDQEDLRQVGTACTAHCPPNLGGLRVVGCFWGHDAL